jgi:threonyl-tRNA synthetase
VQVRVLPVAAGHREASNELVTALARGGVRADVDGRDETLGKRIRDAELQKTPYVVVWGDRETREALAVRKRGGEGVSTMSLDALVEEIAAQSPA